MKLLIHSQSSTIVPAKFRNGWVISSHTSLGIRILIHAGIKPDPCTLQWYQENLSLLVQRFSLHVVLQRYCKNKTTVERTGPYNHQNYPPPPPPPPTRIMNLLYYMLCTVWCGMNDNTDLSDTGCMSTRHDVMMAASLDTVCACVHTTLGFGQSSNKPNPLSNTPPPLVPWPFYKNNLLPELKWIKKKSILPF